jgi:hypothetical protein
MARRGWNARLAGAAIAWGCLSAMGCAGFQGTYDRHGTYQYDDPQAASADQVGWMKFLSDLLTGNNGNRINSQMDASFP